MSSGSRNKQTEIDGKLVNELRQGYGLGASFFRAAAARIEMTDTDMQVIDILESTGEATAGQLAHLMGLTTGTFTAILNRLEKAGLVRRERDPNDGRRVIVRLVTGSDGKQEINPLFAFLGKAWEEMAAQYDDEQKKFLLEFLQRSNTLAKEEIARLREASVGDEGIFSAPLVDDDRVMLSHTHTWLRSIPNGMHPKQLCRHYPRIANRIATSWGDVPAVDRLLMDLMVDRRGNRPGCETLAPIG
jgi:DNA-binding MarR family transcriptional regulator